ncbi:MAG: hypothetical protein BJ554DRAFT_3692 [Olpidium bornovanus]|uniref:Uncharacterized protein n=1 Tax=Olpidium bornovanus TaxID=278681 RepID=A0A8H7ZNR9_9FUNG|nr:MAG: hypothetical protein BJ554DRAFT_3692 [Olpidium bornovanus]
MEQAAFRRVLDLAEHLGRQLEANSAAAKEISERARIVAWEGSGGGAPQSPDGRELASSSGPSGNAGEVGIAGQAKAGKRKEWHLGHGAPRGPGEPIGVAARSGANALERDAAGPEGGRNTAAHVLFYFGEGGGGNPSLVYVGYARRRPAELKVVDARAVSLLSKPGASESRRQAGPALPFPEQLPSEHFRLLEENAALMAENTQLSALVREHEQAIDVIMQRFRAHTQAALEEKARAKRDAEQVFETERNAQTELSAENAALREAMRQIGDTLRDAMDAAAAEDAERESLISRLLAENEAIRGMLGIAARAGSIKDGAGANAAWGREARTDARGILFGMEHGVKTTQGAVVKGLLPAQCC